MAKLDIYLATENHLGEIEIVDSDIITGNNLNDCFEQFQEVEEEYASTNYEVGILDKDAANEYYDWCRK